MWGTHSVSNSYACHSFIPYLLSLFFPFPFFLSHSFFSFFSFFFFFFFFGEKGTVVQGEPKSLRMRMDPSALGMLGQDEAVRRVGKSTFFRPSDETPMNVAPPQAANSDLSSFHIDFEELFAAQQAIKKGRKEERKKSIDVTTIDS